MSPLSNRKLMPLEVARKQGWRLLAGTFETKDEQALAEKVMQYLESSGAKVALVATIGRYGADPHTTAVNIWRCGSEMETKPQTEDRLKRLKLNKQ